MSIIAGVWETVQKEFLDKNYSQLITVELEIGEFLDVVDESLELCWEAVTMEYPFAVESTLIIKKEVSIAKCQNCGEEWDFKKHWYICPKCGVSNSKIITGKQLQITSMEVE